MQDSEMSTKRNKLIHLRDELLEFNVWWVEQISKGLLAPQAELCEIYDAYQILCRAVGHIPYENPIAKILEAAEIAKAAKK